MMDIYIRVMIAHYNKEHDNNKYALYINHETMLKFQNDIALHPIDLRNIFEYEHVFFNVNIDGHHFIEIELDVRKKEILVRDPYRDEGKQKDMTFIDYAKQYGNLMESAVVFLLLST